MRTSGDSKSIFSETGTLPLTAWQRPVGTAHGTLEMRSLDFITDSRWRGSGFPGFPVPPGSHELINSDVFCSMLLPSQSGRLNCSPSVSFITFGNNLHWPSIVVHGTKAKLISQMFLAGSSFGQLVELQCDEFGIRTRGWNSPVHIPVATPLCNLAMQ